MDTSQPSAESVSEIDLQPLQTFFVCASSQTFTEAAGRLNLCQSAVSHAIRKLERNLGQTLIDRDQTPIRLTEAGQLLFQSCERVFLELRHCREQLAQDPDRPLTGRLRIGATVEFGNSVLAREIAPFLREHPGIEPSLTFSHDLLKPLLADDLDIIIDCRPHARDDLSRFPLFRERYVLVASPSLIRRKQVTRLTDIERLPWLSTDRAGEWWQRLLTHLPPGIELNPGRLLPINHLRGMINLAAAGVGIALVPAYCVRSEVRDRRLKLLFPRMQIREDHFSLYCKRLRKDSPKIRAFLEFMRNLDPAQFETPPA